MNARTPSMGGRAARGDRITRHAGIDRAIHWIGAACVLTLLGTAFLPILGLEFPWVTLHWVTGAVLIAVVFVHILRALLWQDFGSIWIDSSDLRDALAILRTTLRIGGEPPNKPGKYSFAQKLIHWAFAAVVLLSIATGAVIMVKIDTPWWQRNPYWLGDPSWGLIYSLHDLAALCLVTMVMTHVYFAIRPEKRAFTRSMIFGWITRKEYRDQHDPNRWQVDR